MLRLTAPDRAPELLLHCRLSVEGWAWLAVLFQPPSCLQVPEQHVSQVHHIESNLLLFNDVPQGGSGGA